VAEPNSPGFTATYPRRRALDCLAACSHGEPSHVSKIGGGGCRAGLRRTVRRLLSAQRCSSISSRFCCSTARCDVRIALLHMRLAIGHSKCNREVTLA